jgi:enoyl-CoA hydratase/carnithine racemase
MYEDLLVERRDDVELVTLNRPRSLNALTLNSYRELEDAIRGCTARCMVITGTDPAFCSGDDVHEFMMSGALTKYLESDSALYSFTDALLYARMPIIAAVNGAAVGWGMELALTADIRIASERARFGEIFVTRGLATDVPGLGRLAQLIGREHAARLLFTGEIIDAERAAAIGLVSEVVRHEDVVARALALATAIAERPPLAVERIKEGMGRALDPDWRDLGMWVRAQQAELSRSEDHQESARAYVEKRPARIVGR